MTEVKEEMSDQEKAVVYDGGCFYKYQMVEDKKEKARIISDWKWLKSYGNYNKMPEPFFEISYDEYIQFSRSYTPKYVEHRQVRDVIEGRFPDCHISWFHKYGLCLVYPGRWTLDYDTKREVSHIVWEEPVCYFYIGCNHKFRELGSAECRERGIKHFGMCWHVVECEKCGYVESYDSSG